MLGNFEPQRRLPRLLLILVKFLSCPHLCQREDSIPVQCCR